MSEKISVRGMVLSSGAVGEYDRRLVILTTDRGKITAFARGVKRPGNALMAACSPFVFADFMLFQGRDAYTVASASVINYFEQLRDNMRATCYGCYFLEFAAYYGRENADDLQMLGLLYQTVRALCKGTIDYRLIRVIYELKLMAINVEYPDVFECGKCRRQEGLSIFSVPGRKIYCSDCGSSAGWGSFKLSEAAVYTMQYIVATPVEKLYTFTVSEEVLASLITLMTHYRRSCVDRTFKSLEILEVMED